MLLCLQGIVCSFFYFTERFDSNIVKQVGHNAESSDRVDYEIQSYEDRKDDPVWMNENRKKYSDEIEYASQKISDPFQIPVFFFRNIHQFFPSVSIIP